FSLAFLSQADMLKVADTYLKCRCGHSYSKEASDNRPTILDCGHLACTKCAKENIKSRRRCKEPGCKRKSSTYRPAIDLAWVMERSPVQFTTCDVCDKNHTKELCPPHR
ncbi:hypothetical protein PFISCL1PPCAC_9459, partial [Pristionchus fissidentatus]